MFMKYFKNLFSLGLNFLSQYDKESLSSMEQISDNDNYLIQGFFSNLLYASKSIQRNYAQLKT